MKHSLAFVVALDVMRHSFQNITKFLCRNAWKQNASDGLFWPLNVYDADAEGQVFMSQYFKYIFSFTTSYEKMPLTSNSIEILKKKFQR